MKIVRQSLADLDNETRKKSPWGVRPSDLYHGRIHHFYIEKATPAELSAIDDLLLEAGWESDTCPNYESDDEFGHAGYSCGYWIDIEEVDRFRADYKRLKREIGARVALNLTKSQGETLDAMTEDEVKCIARVSRQVARELRTKQESLTGLRGIGTYRDIIHNPYHNTHNPLTKQGWKLIHTVLHVGTLKHVIAGLHKLEEGCEASAERLAVIPELMKRVQGATYDEAHHAILRADFCFETAATWLHELKRKQVDADLAKCQPDIRNMTESEKTEAFDAARKMDRLIGNVDLLPESGLNAADADFVIAATERRYPGMMAADILTAHTEALARDEVFNTCNARFHHFWGAYSYLRRREVVEQAHEAAVQEDRLYTDSMRAIAAPGGAYVYLVDESVKRQSMNVAHRDALEINANYGKVA